MTRRFEDFMKNNLNMIIFLRWDTVAYLKYLESHYDEDIYRTVYSLLKSIDSLLDFYMSNFSGDISADIPDIIFEKNKIGNGMLFYISGKCSKCCRFYADKWKYSRIISAEENSCNSELVIYSRIYGCLNRICKDCEKLLKYEIGENYETDTK